MLSPHLLRPFTAQQLNLASRDERVMVLAALGGRSTGPSLQVHAPTLISRVTATLAHTDVAVFIDDPLPDHATMAIVASMLDSFGDECALVRAVPVTEAMKRLRAGQVAESVDRSTLFSPRPPEIARVTALREAIEHLGTRQWVNPAAAIARAGGSVRVFEEAALQPH